jgi:hypothetical protein
VHCANSGSGPQYVDAGLFGSRTAQVSVLSADARLGAGAWKFTTMDPGEGWMGQEHADAGWTEGPGGFGSKDLYADWVGSEWLVDEIWMRRTFAAERVWPEYQLTLHHDDDIEVYLNGRLVLQRSGWSPQYSEVLLTAAEAGVVKGDNVLAVHCRNAGTGPQFVDVGLLALEPLGATRVGRKTTVGKTARSGKDARATRYGFLRGAPGRLEFIRADGKSLAIP